MQLQLNCKFLAVVLMRVKSLCNQKFNFLFHLLFSGCNCYTNTKNNAIQRNLSLGRSILKEAAAVGFG